MNWKFHLGLGLFIFCTVIQHGMGKSILAERNLVRAAEECCLLEQRECCVERLKSEKDINCKNMTDLMGVVRCLEKALFVEHPNSVFAHNCCRLLYKNTCREKCVYNLWTPSMQPEKKLDFINSCRPVKNGPNCWLDGFIHIHDCFHHCVEQTHKNGRNFDFDPADHCPGFLDIDKRELCILGSQK